MSSEKNVIGEEVICERVNKSKNKDEYRLLYITQSGRFKVVTMQVDLPEDERKILNQSIAKKAFNGVQ
jgi:hypothetical protein